MHKTRQTPFFVKKCCEPIARQHGFVLLPVVLAITLIAAIAFMLNNQSAINVDITAGVTEAVQAEHVARSGLAHATWGAQNSGCAGDMSMTTVPFGQGGIGSYTATITTPGGGTTAYPNLTADQDAWFRSDNITVNNGTTATYHLRKESGNLEYAVVRFDLSTLPAGAQINSATARFYVKATKGHPEGPVNVHRVTADWTETAATWETMGDKFDSAVLNSIPAQPDAGDVWVEVNLTAQVQAWVNGGEPNYGIMLIPTGEGTHGEYVSHEGAASQQPRLDIVVGTGSASPMTITATGTLTGNPSPANDVTRSLTRTNVPAYQPTSYSFLQLQPGSGKDAWIDSFYTSRNYGDHALDLDSVGTLEYSLMRFDLPAIPPGARILSARLELYHMATAGTPADPGAEVHRVRRDWVEGTQSGSGSADGVTWETWNGTNNWTQSGGDYDVAPIASGAISAATNDWEVWEIRELVQGWVDGTFPNYGLVLKGTGSVEVSFASKEDADPTLHPKLSITYACECGSACIAPQGWGNVLMVIGSSPSSPSASDDFLRDRFESWGYSVTFIQDDDSQGNFDAAVANNDVVFISESVSTGNVGAKLQTAPIGVVNQQGSENDEVGVAAGMASPIGNQINVTDTSHYITSIFPAGTLAIYDGSMELLVANGTEASQQLADFGGAGALIAADVGTPLVSIGNAAGRRVMVPLGRESTVNLTRLNNNGWLILQRALQWGTGNTGEPAQKLLLVVANPGNLTSQENAKKALMESWGYTVNLIDESDSQANFDTAIADNDVAYIPQDINSSNLGTKLANATIGVVNEEGEQVDELGIAQDKLFKDRMEVDILDNSHYITQPFATGLLAFVSSDQSVHMLISNTAPGLTTLAQSFNVGSNWHPSLAVIEVGGDLWGGGTAAGRRVELPWGGGTFDVAALNADGQTIMQRAIEWAEGAGAVPAPTYTVLMVVSVPSSLTPAAADRKTLMESWGYTVNLIDDDDSAVNFDAGIAASDVVYVGSGSVGTTIGTKLDATTKGVVNEPVSMASTLGFASSWTVAINVDQLTIVDSTHSITQGLANPVTVFTALESPAVLSGTLAPDLQNLAEAGASPAVVVLETGAATHDAGTTAGRRAQLPFAGAGPGELAADGQLMVRRAIEWAAGPGGGGGGGSGSVVYESFEEYIDADNNSAAISVAKPAGTATGDLLVAVVVTNRNNQSTLVADDAGWNLLTVDAQASSSTTGVWWKVAGGFRTRELWVLVG